MSLFGPGPVRLRRIVELLCNHLMPQRVDGALLLESLVNLRRLSSLLVVIPASRALSVPSPL